MGKILENREIRPIWGGSGDLARGAKFPPELMEMFPMMTFARLILAGGLLAAAAGTAAASEAEFLQSLDGKWAGTGSVKVRTDSSPIKVNCNFQSDASATALSLDGNCRGLLIISRAVGADLKTNGAKYAGSYVGAGTGTAGLSGSRSGNAINLSVRWAKEVNGDREARLTVQKVGDNGMKLTTVDVDPETGKDVVTSEINLRRS
jgi:hypothetical protein